METDKLKVVILGHTGYLGSYLIEKLREDDNLEIFESGQRIVEPDFLINCTGRVSVEQCESQPLLSLDSNCTYFMNKVEDLRPKCIINFSSYYVYRTLEYGKSDSEVNFDTVYTRHKLLSEYYTAINGGVNIRLGKLFGKDSGQERFVEHCINSSLVLADSIVCPFTYIEDVFDLVSTIIYMTDPNRSGSLKPIVNCVTGNMSHYRMAQIIKTILGKNDQTIELVPNLCKFDGYGFFKMECVNDRLEEVMVRYLRSLNKNA